jgi:hypothetical protein
MFTFGWWLIWGAAQACRDGFTAPLPLHPNFFELLVSPPALTARGRRRLLASLGRTAAGLAASDDWTAADLVRAYAAVSRSQDLIELEKRERA